MRIAVFNVGSTSLKYATYDTESRRRGVEGNIQRIGHPQGDAQSHEQAAESAIERCMQQQVDAIGHRIVQGGEYFHQPMRVDENVLEQLRELDPLAPLHNPPARRVVERLHTQRERIPQVLVFDTAYFANLPKPAATYAIPTELAAKHRIRRYGAHGTSHQYVTQQAIQYLRTRHRPGDEGAGDSALRIISLHLGGGASVTASRDLNTIETSMGLTPLEGLVMATRSGDIDPSLPYFLSQHAGLDSGQIDHLLNWQSGLQGLCGETDMRRILSRCAAGDSQPELAVDVYVHRIKKYVGAYLALLGGLDCLIFTAGVGTHSPEIRQRVCAGLSQLGIELNSTRNERGLADTAIQDIASDDSPTRVLIVETDEEWSIAAQTQARLE